MAHKKRKISDLTNEDTGRLLLALVAFQENLDDTDEDLPPELLPAVRKLAEKLQVVPHMSFSRVDEVILSKLGIVLRPMSLLAKKRAEIEALGLVEAEGNWLTIDATRELIRLIYSHVSLVNEAGSRVLITVFLLRLASVMRRDEVEVNIIPEFPVSRTVLQGHSFGGIVHFLVTQTDPTYNDLLLNNPVATLAPQNTKFTHQANIFEAKRQNVRDALPQAVVAAASYCKEHKLSVMRGCITSGEEWAFFVYKAGASGQGEVVVASQIKLGSNLEELALLLGLLRDWVENATEYEQKFFKV